MGSGHELAIDTYGSELISRSQTAFSSFVFGWEEKGSGERPI